MDVFLVPVGRETYELYCEHVDETEAPVLERPESFWARLNPRYLFALLRQRFHQMLLEAEEKTKDEMATLRTELMKQGSTADQAHRQAWEMVREKYILLPPEET